MSAQTSQQEIEKLRAEMESIRKEVNELKKGQEVTNKKLKRRKRKIDGSTSKIPAKKSTRAVDFQKRVTTPPAKRFQMKHMFRNVSDIKDGDSCISEDEHHFGTTWSFVLQRKEGYLRSAFRCTNRFPNWTVEFHKSDRVIGSCGAGTGHIFAKFASPNSVEGVARHGFSKLIKWEDIKTSGLLVDDTLTIEVDVVIEKVTGFCKRNLQNFDESMEKYSDVVLLVRDHKFYVLKQYLAKHSPYFDSLLMGSFLEANQSEVELHGLDPCDVQNYLEVLYGESSIDETTVEGILLVSDANYTPIVKRKCQEFLLEKSQKKLKKLFEMFIKYHLDMPKILERVVTKEDLQSLASSDLALLDKDLMAALLEKCLS